MSFLKPLLATSGLIFLSGCASVMTLTDKNTGDDLFLTNKPVYTLVNLHPDDARSKLYSVNFQQDGLIPLCTQVDIVNVSTKRLTFKIDSSGREYILDKHKSSPDFAKYLSNYFGTECNTAEVKKIECT